MTNNEEISLREFLESLLTERQKSDGSRWLAHEQVHIQESQARQLATNDMNRRLDEMNLFREQINRERGEFLSKETFYLKHDEISKQLEASSSRMFDKINEIEKWRSNIEGKMWMLGAVLTAITVGLNLLFKWIK